MSIAYDTSSASAYSPSEATWSHTCTGSNRLLVAGIYATNDTLTGVTYAGVSMTFINKVNATGTQFIYLYYLLNPTSGANNLVTSSGGTLLGYGQASSYTGAKQSAQPDTSNTAVSASTTSLTCSVTTVADNCWLIGYNYSNLPVAGGGTTFRSPGIGAVLFMMDSNAPKTPAGSSSLEVTQVSANFSATCLASFSPVGASFTPSPDNRMYFM